METKRDDGLEWRREIRCKMAAKFHHDPRKADACHQKMQRDSQGFVAFPTLSP